MYVYAYISFSLVPPWDLRVCKIKDRRVETTEQQLKHQISIDRSKQ